MPITEAQERPVAERLRATINRIVLQAPRRALTAGIAMISLDIYFRSRGAETSRQYVISLGEIILQEWEALRAPAS